MKKSIKKVIKIIYNPTILYTDNVTESFEVIRQTDKGIIIGHIIDGEFLECGFISKRNIKKIYNGTKRKR
jgi:hypothetical protein